MEDDSADGQQSEDSDSVSDSQVSFTAVGLVLNNANVLIRVIPDVSDIGLS